MFNLIKFITFFCIFICNANAIHTITTAQVRPAFQASNAIGYIFHDREQASSAYYENEIVSLDASLPADPSNYSEITATFELDGRADDGFKFYLNGVAIYDESKLGSGSDAGFCHDGCGSVDKWDRRKITKTLNLTQAINSIKIVNYNNNNGSSGDFVFWEIWSAKVTITAKGK